MVMKYSESAELEDKTACAGVRADLKMCLLESECCRGRQHNVKKKDKHLKKYLHTFQNGGHLKSCVSNCTKPSGQMKIFVDVVVFCKMGNGTNKMTPRQCLLSHDPSVEQCIPLKTLFFECKRSILDQRTRFRGRKGY